MTIEPGIEAVRAQLRSGDLTGAAESCEPLLGIGGDGEPHYLLGVAECALGLHARAVEHLSEAVAIQPDRAGWRYNLGVACIAANLPDQALAELSKALDLGYEEALCQTALVKALLLLKRFSEALALCQNLNLTDSQTPSALHDLAQAQAGMKLANEAVVTWERVLQIDPAFVAAHAGLEELYVRANEHRRGLIHAEAAGRLRPDCPHTMARLGSAYWYCGRLEEALMVHELAVALPGADENVRSARLFTMLHVDSLPPEQILRAHRDCTEVPTDSLPGNFLPEPPAPRSGRSPLRVGYVNGELYFHASFFFLSPFLLSDPEPGFERLIYHTGPRCDECTAALRLANPTFFHCPGLSSVAFARLVRQHEIDVLVDCSGHYAHNALGSFRLRAAPVQVTFPNYPASTGLPEMDYFLTDTWNDPPGMTEAHYTETLFRLPSGHLVYRPGEQCPPVSRSPALENGYVTFGLFQRPAKLNARVWDAIARTLERVPGSHLLTHFLSADVGDALSPLRLRITGELRRRGIEGDRLEWFGSANYAGHMEILGRADMAFDTFPYNGQTTVCECLWMGVPTVALEGSTHISRKSASLLRRAGLDEWVASSLEEYVAAAVRQASHPKELAELRHGLRDRLAMTSLSNGAQLAHEMNDAYREMCNRVRFRPACV